MSYTTIMRRSIAAALPALTALACTAALVAGEPALFGPTIEAVRAVGNQFNPKISGDLIVYAEASVTDFDVRAHNIATGVTYVISDTPDREWLADVDAGRIVYFLETSPRNIMYADSPTATPIVLVAGTNEAEPFDPAISGDYVVYQWLADSAFVSIRALQLSTGLIKEFGGQSGSSRLPEVGGGILTYQNTSSVLEVRMVDLDSCVWTDPSCDPAASELTLGPGERPRTDGSTVVYERETSNDRDVVIYDVATGLEQVLRLAGAQSQPDVDGDFITFDTKLGFNADVVVLHLPTGVSARVGGGTAENVNALDGSRVAYVTESPVTGTKADIYIYDFALRMTELFGVNSSDDGLSMIDSATAQVEFIGPLDPDQAQFTTPIAMAVRPSDGQIFAWNNTPTGGLVSVDPCTGRGNAVGSGGPVLAGLAFDRTGALYGIDDYFLYDIDPQTGAASVLADHNQIGPKNGLDFGPDGFLYAMGKTDPDSVNKIYFRPFTGGLNVAVPISEDIDVIGSMAFTPTGSLLASGFGTPYGGVLFDLDPATGVVSNLRSIVGGSAPQGMGFAPPCPFVLSPANLNFGDVEVGEISTQVFDISNDGDTSFAVSSVSATGGAFSVDAPLTPFEIDPGVSVSVSVDFAPSSESAQSGMVSIASTRGGRNVALTGVGVDSEPPPSEQIADILEFFDDAVIAGSLSGAGAGNSANGRRDALRNMIEAAGDLYDGGDSAAACEQLLDAYNRTDGATPPPDFVDGEAAAELAVRIQALRAALACG